ncbi:MAG TPA: hypothetical protein PLD73_03100 [Candidatus Hydrogenedentes bacterium]|jgi:hypothetical protein|nr:hypothetical protein [Candidatus Hydrogenedentota bacterium]
MKHIKSTSKICRPEVAQIPIVSEVFCAIFPAKHKCEVPEP